MVVKDSSDTAVDAAVRDIEIILGPFGITFIDLGAKGRAGGAQPRVKGVGVLLVRDRRGEIGAAAAPTLGRREETRVHMNRGNMRARHIGEADRSGGKIDRVLPRAPARAGASGG